MVLQTTLYRNKATVDKRLDSCCVTEFSGYDALQQRVCSDRIAVLSYEAAT
jgi:hypothetical protein